MNDQFILNPVLLSWFSDDELEPHSYFLLCSASVFGVSAESMQCSYDNRGNSVPTILLMMQSRLYSEGGLEAEGIFRINAENSQEEYVRSQLNRGVVPPGIDVHSLAGLIKAWFRELPAGVLDSLTPEQVMNCNTEEECTQVASLLQPTEFALLDWAINLMADVVQHEHQNKMNARNIAMVFAPNMTQMADPLTALLHAVQVMNFLKTLIIKVLREREKSSAEVSLFSSCSESPNNKDDPNLSKSNRDTGEGSCEQAIDVCVGEGPPVLCSFPRSSSHDRLERDSEEIFWSLQEKSETGEDHESICGNNNEPPKCHTMYMENECGGGGSGNVDVEGFSDRVSWREGVRKLCRHPVFQLSRPPPPIKKPAGFGIINI
ncbi:Rho GTPase-activating protein domain [Macleaya cordata]|uniref:Rho GTPase-activating protein domain n=1 Tax=Macleaya cordata TaxID=56857 RepID=A0A200QWA8_MACCD|nr:Rho GTPase-activating protein domain [Macleaya cordata]